MFAKIYNTIYSESITPLKSARERIKFEESQTANIYITFYPNNNIR